MDEKKRIEELVKTLNEASEAYYNGQDEIMSNYEWDGMFDELTRLEEKTGYILPESPTQNAGFEESNGEREAHEYPALSLAKTKRISDLQVWAGERPVWLSWKLDGLTLVVTYDNGNVFQHFGKTENFKVYEVEDNKVVSSEVIGSNGTGHGALAGLLAEQGIDVLICGGIGGGARNALAEAGVQLCSGAQGNTDEVVEAYLKGELVSAGTTCDHHHHEEGHSCGDHEEGHSCGGTCGGGCGSHKPAFTGPNVGKTCRTHYKGTFNDGTQFDSSYDRGQPLEFVCGAGQMIKGFDAAVANMEVGEIKEIHLMPEEAYGMPDPNAIFTLEIAQLPGSEDLTVGQQVYLSNQYGQPFPVKVTAKEETTITFDANHEMAGKELNFKIELVEVK